MYGIKIVLLHDILKNYARIGFICDTINYVLDT